LPELVIKGNRTIPEYGGGLCQIGTTVFRATLASGLPVTARRNHSYRVVYYEPAGTDATIYDPAPDYKFVNDTGGTVLIQTRIEGDDLIFEFWGKPDGRIANQTKPRIFNITPPPPTKIIETEDLPVGEKKCTEKPHSGADTEFTYTVTYPNGEVKQEVFKSHYIPWQEVCLIGVPKGTLTPPDVAVPESDDSPTTEAPNPLAQ
jgi:vancomycin resistance protein YoaR